jgi:hypothetical protein
VFLQALVDGLAGQHHRERRALADLVGEGAGGVEHLGARHDVVHEAHALALGGGEALAGEHQLAGARGPDDARQQVGRAQLRHHPHAREEEADLRLRTGDAHVAEERHGGADAERVAVQHGDGRLRQLAHELREVLDACGAAAAAAARAGAATGGDLLGEESHVGAGAEGAVAAAGEQHGADGGVAVGRAERLDQLTAHDRRPGVELLGPVERDRRDAVGDGVGDLLVAHGRRAL